MDSLLTGSVQSWLAVVVATLKPIDCANRWVRGRRLVAPRRQLGRTGAHAPLEGAEGQGRKGPTRGVCLARVGWPSCGVGSGQDQGAPN